MTRSSHRPIEARSDSPTKDSERQTRRPVRPPPCEKKKVRRGKCLDANTGQLSKEKTAKISSLAPGGTIHTNVIAPLQSSQLRALAQQGAAGLRTLFFFETSRRTDPLRRCRPQPHGLGERARLARKPTVFAGVLRARTASRRGTPVLRFGSFS